MEPININKVNQFIHKSISDQDLEKYFTKAIQKKILVFGDLRKYNSIDEVLPKQKDFIIMLIETAPNIGHWCCLTKNNGVVTWFDSYGMKPGSELKFVDEDKRAQLNEDRNYLGELLQKTKYKVEYNTIAFQSDGDNVRDCGRYVILYLILFNEKNFNLKQFQQFMKNETKKLKLSYDQLVSYLIE